mgnify:FL=1
MRKPRNITAIALLLCGTVWSLPMQSGHDDSGPEPTPGYSAIDPATFGVSAYRGKLKLAGHTSSLQHEQRLERAAAQHFPRDALQFEYRPLGVVPRWWDEATIELLTLLAATTSPSARLGKDELQIKAIVGDKSVIESRLRALRDILPAATDIDIQLTEVDTGLSAAALCQQQFSRLKPGPVAFAESGTEMRASAYPVLDRIIALADACRDARISITGHTDSSGSEAWNRQLSLARAQAVAEHLEKRGIDAGRLVIAGAGSSQPIADNATRYGRGQNRRIEFRLEPAR